MSRFQIDSESYGPWTQEFRRLLDLADEVEFFCTDARLDEYVAGLAVRLTGLLSESLVVRVEVGNWLRCRDLMGHVEPWAKEFGRVVEERTERIMSDSILSGLIGPPLWPVRGMLNVVEVVVADKEKVLASVPPEFEEIAWRLGCAVENWTWGALRWSIAREGEENPYEIAVRLATRGVYTLGKHEGELVFFAFGAKSNDSDASSLKVSGALGSP